MIELLQLADLEVETAALSSGAAPTLRFVILCALVSLILIALVFRRGVVVAVILCIAFALVNAVAPVLCTFV